MTATRHKAPDTTETSQPTVVVDAGHFVMIEAPAEFNRILATILEGLSRN